MKKTVLFILALAVAGVSLWFFSRESDVPLVPFAKATRVTISSQLSTNGKVEPVDYREVHVQTAGVVNQLMVHAGQTVREGQLLARMSEPGLEQELEAAAAREAQATSDLKTLQGGGRSSDAAELDGSLNRVKGDRDAAQRNLDALQRLYAKQAATAYEVEQTRQQVASLDVQIQALQKRRTSLVGKDDVAGAEARVREAHANVLLAQNHITQDLIRAPMSGTVYDLPAHAGSYLSAGDLVARIGKLDPVRVRVYVDEPDLGRVGENEPVRITWDALPGKDWTGTVERRPTQVITLGTRQVGEVLCTIHNPMYELVPGTNVNAFILTQVVKDALTIPKSGVRRDNGTGAFLLQKGNIVRWQPIRTGVSDALRVQALEGIQDGDAVSIATDQILKNGQKVNPAFQ